jgi:hypothetical protein
VTDQYVVKVYPVRLLSRTIARRSIVFRECHQDSIVTGARLGLRKLQLVLLTEECQDKIEITLAYERNSVEIPGLGAHEEPLECILVVDHVADGPFEELVASPAYLINPFRCDGVLDVPAVDSSDDYPPFLGELAKDDVGHAERYADYSREIPLFDGPCIVMVIDALQKSILVIGCVQGVQSMNIIYRRGN